MPTISVTIPKNIASKDDLVMVPRKEYEKLFRFWESAEQPAVRGKETRHGFSGLESGLQESFQEVSNGKLRGPFKTSKSFLRALKTRSR